MPGQGAIHLRLFLRSRCRTAPLRSGARQGKACGFRCKLAPVIHRNTLDYRKTSLQMHVSWCQ